LSDSISLLSDLSDFIRRFVALTRAQSDACALWVAHTHTIEATDFTPYLNINSPLPRSGKTTLLQLLKLLVANPWCTGRVTAAVLVRKTDKEHPSLLLDESDAAFQANREYAEALRGVLNTGYERDGTYSMCVQVKNDWVPKDFSTFCPKAIAGIGSLPDTVEDRSIPIRLKRKLPNQGCECFRKRKVRPEAEALRDRTAKWARGNMNALTDSEPQMPSKLNDRQQDVCEPLIAIADIAGYEWPERARQALIELLAVQATGEDSHGVRLLVDIHSCFEAQGTERLRSSELLDKLRGIEESPWADYWRGLPLSVSELARLLRPFEIRPRDLRFPDGVRKGYVRADFEDAWTRYCTFPDLEGQQGQHTAVHAGVSDLLKGQRSPSVADSKSEESPIDMRGVAGVAPEHGDKGNGLGLSLPFCSHSQESWWQRNDGGWVCGVCHPNSFTGGMSQG
jgi:hypothetical protein